MSGRHYKLFLIFSLITLLFVSVSAQTDTDTDASASASATSATSVSASDSDSANPNPNPIPDTIFSEISLSEDGVSAIDQQGNDWFYDFNSDMFVRGLLQRSSATHDNSNDTEPVESRCIIEKKIKPSITKDIIIDVDEYVDHDINVFGRVTVKGWVKGNITSYKNRVIVKSTGQVDGDITAPKIIIHDNGTVLGELIESSLEIPTELPSNGAMVIIIIMSVLCVFLFLIIALLPQKLEVVSDCFNRYTVRSTFLGFIFFVFGMPVVMALTAITIVGIVLVPFIPLVYVFAAVLGIATFSYTVGNLVFSRFLSPGNQLFMKSFLGFSLFAIFWILGITFMTESDESIKFGFGVFFFVISIIFSIVPIFGGIGASVLTRFGYRPYLSWKDRIALNPQTFTPAPPPMPKGPEIKVPPRRPDNS